MKKKFRHEFEDCSQNGTLSFDIEPPDEVKIKMDVEQDGNFWLSANRAGWLYLAGICVELGLGEYEDGYHFHKDKNFKSSEEPPEFLFEVDNTK